MNGQAWACMFLSPCFIDRGSEVNWHPISISVRMTSPFDGLPYETVMSTDRNLLLLQKAKEQGYFVRGIYVLTANADINVARVTAREALGGHGVPEDKVRLRYERALKLIPQLVNVCDILHIYDNTTEPFRIFKKRKDVFFRWSNEYWNDSDIEKLTGIKDYIE